MSQAFHIYAPSGKKILLQTPDPDPAASPEITREAFDRAFASTVQKKVRNRAVTLTTVQDRERGRQKPTPINFDTLRQVAQRNEWARAIINIRKRKIGAKQWSITLKDTDDPTGAAAEAARVLTNLLKYPQIGGSRPTSLQWPQFIGMFIEDLLVIDRATVEKEWNGNGWPVALYNVDGATIRPNMDEGGGFYRDAYVQVVDGMKTAEFGMEDLICALYNPMTDVKMLGYGFSPLEAVIISVTADLYASKYNADYFQKGAIPEGILSLGQDVDPEHVTAFAQYWMSEIVGKPWNLPIIGGSEKPEFIDWRESHRDMQFMEYQDWLLQKMCAVFEISKQEVGQITDVNRSTAEEQGSESDEKSVQPLLDFIKNTLDLEVIGLHGAGLHDYLEFTWEQAGDTAEAINRKFQPMVESGTASRKEWRDAHGMDDPPEGTVGAEGLDMHLSSGNHSPLPSSDDIQHMGPAAERQQAMEDQQLGFEREDSVSDRERAGADDAGGGDKSGMPWKPADGEDPDVKAAMSDHDRERGIGPRDVGKSHPAGHDRHPQVTERVTGLEDEFALATAQLVKGLTDLVGA